MNLDKKKVYFIDQTSESEHHMVFNACMLEICSKIFNPSEIISVGIESNQESIEKLLGDSIVRGIKYQSIKYTKPIYDNIFFKTINFFNKEIKRFLNFNKILRKVSSSDIIVLSITTFSSFLFFKIQSMFFKKEILAVLHGDLDFVYNTYNFYEKVNGFCYKLIFKLKKNNFKYIVLNKISKKKLIEDKYLNENEIFEINHPYKALDNLEGLSNVKPMQSLTIGHIGSLEVKRKNSHLIYELGELIKTAIEEGKVNLKAVGLSSPYVSEFRNKWVSEIVGNDNDQSPKYLPRNKYESELKKLDYAIFFYNPDQYIFRASGAIADAIAYNIPIIAFKHPIFDYLFSKAGNIGHICSNIQEMKNLIFEIKNNPKKYIELRNFQKENFLRLKELMSVEGISKDLKMQMTNSFFQK